MISPEEIGPFLAKTRPRLLAVVFAIMLCLFVATGFLTRAFNREKRTRAEQQYLAGEALVAQGRYEAAVDMYTEALTLSRGRAPYHDYLEALALALVEAGRTDEAETYLLELTGDDPANGIANLMLARIYYGRDDDASAMQHYQRAIYGLWDEEPIESRRRVRLELVGVLEQQQRHREMEAELLRLLEEIPDDAEIKKEVARLFLSAQSYDVAQKLFTEVTVDNPRDAEAFAGLGDAEFELGHYFSARTAYRQALRYRSDDLQSQTQYDLATDVISLDPTIRGLGSAVQLNRSRILVERALKGLSYCLPEERDLLPEEVRGALGQAENLASGKTRQRQTLENVEQNIELAEQLEKYRTLNCGAAPVPDRALELVLRKLAQ